MAQFINWFLSAPDLVKLILATAPIWLTTIVVAMTANRRP